MSKVSINNPDLYDIHLDDVRGINILKVVASGRVFSSQEVKLKLTKRELY
jgi:hypothetical protein